MARPKLEINKTIFEGLCKIQCTKDEIIGVLKVSDSTLSRWCKRTYNMNFEEIFKNYSMEGKMSLRRSLFKQIDNGSTAALIFACKNYLGMSDKVEHSANSDSIDKLNNILTAIKMTEINKNSDDS